MADIQTPPAPSHNEVLDHLGIGDYKNAYEFRGTLLHSMHRLIERNPFIVLDDQERRELDHLISMDEIVSSRL